MPEDNKVKLHPKIYFHLLFRAYIEIINKNQQSSASFEFECTYCDLYYEMYNTDEKVKDIANKIIKDGKEHGCCIYTPPECAKFTVNPEKLLDFVKSYLDSIIGSESFILPLEEEQSLYECARVHPYKNQHKVFKNIIDSSLGKYIDSFDFDFSMLDRKEYGGIGDSVHKRFCIDELLLILQKEKLIGGIEVRKGKDYHDADHGGEYAHRPFYKIYKIKKINYNNGFWHDTISKTIGYGENEIASLHFPKNQKPINKAYLLFVFIRNQGKPLSDDDLIKELDEQRIIVSADKLSSLRSDALSLLKTIDEEKIFEITRKKINNVWSYSLTSKRRSN